MGNMLDFIFPKRCPFCDKIINSEIDMCENCSKYISPGVIVKKIILNDATITCISTFKYTGEVAESIKKFKFRNRKDYANSLANFMAKSFGIFYKNENFDIITSVPLHRKGKLERGYNQSEILARKLGKRIHIKYKSVLKKDKLNLQQHKLSYEDRYNNVKGVYSTTNKDIIKGGRILLCDDVITSGNTLKECCKVLYQSGANRISCITLASANKY